MTFSQRFEEIRTGFERPFWIANISELFERLSYYAVFAVLARYLHEGLQFDVERASSLTGMFGGWVWFLAVVGGAVADRLGFRRALSLAYLILSFAYFMMGSIGASWFAPVRNAIPLVPLVAFVLILPALGVALVKPSVVGTTARSSKANVRSVGYSIYYTLVNVGSTMGPLLAGWTKNAEGIFRIAALSVFLMFFLVLILFREPRRSEAAAATSLAQVGRNFLTVLSNPKFMLFLLIFTGYWIVFWQEFIALPFIYLDLYRSQRQHGADSGNRSDRRNIVHDGHRISHEKDACLSRHRSGNLDFEPRMDSADRASFGLDGGCNLGSGGNRRDHTAAEVLRLHFPPGTGRPTRNIHGVRIPAIGCWIVRGGSI